MLPWLTALLAEPPCAPVAALTAPERSATLSAVHAAAFTTRKGHCPEYEQLHKDLYAVWGRQSPASQGHSPAGRQHAVSADAGKQQVCISLSQHVASVNFQHPNPYCLFIEDLELHHMHNKALLPE